MKILQIVNGLCHWDATLTHPTLASTEGRYPPDVVFVEAPDFVFPGWGYDETQTGDGRFVQPELPQPESWTDPRTGAVFHWVYDTPTGTFYMADEDGMPVQPDGLIDAVTALRIIDTLTGEVE